MIAGLFIRLSTDFRGPEDSELIAVLRLPNSSKSGDIRTHRSLETSILFHMDIKPRKPGKKSKIFRKPEGKYGTEQVKMDIRTRKAVKKSKILRKPEGNTETGVNAIKKMDIKLRKAVKKSKNIRKPEGNTEPSR